MPLHRYREFIPDFAEFLEACVRPLPSCVWTNPLRATPDEVERAIRASGVEPRKSRIAGAFLTDAEWNAGSTVAHFCGLYHAQEEVALTAVPALDPQPGERVLDLCAAPGNKTSQIGVAMGNTGTLIANEFRHDRLAGLRGNLERLGVFNAAVVLGDGAGLRLQAGPFDRVLADVPCSCEGTIRRYPYVAARASERSRLKLSRTQTHLLQRAIKLTRPGGVVVYATCTFAPEENEAVIEASLGDQGRVVPFDCALASQPGLTRFGEATYRDDLVHARRFYPHLSDTGGFFVAKIVVDAPRDSRVRDRPPLNTLEEVPADEATALWRDRFGVPMSAFDDLRFYRRGPKVVWAASASAEPGPELNVEAMGVALARVRAEWPKPTTTAALAFGRFATRNVVDFDPVQRDAFLHREMVEIDAGASADDGFVLVRCEGVVLGCGLYLGGRVSSQLSKGRAFARPS